MATVFGRAVGRHRSQLENASSLAFPPRKRVEKTVMPMQMSSLTVLLFGLIVLVGLSSTANCKIVEVAA